MRTKRGFTLVELMIVVAILGILAGLVILQGASARQNASLAGAVYDLTLVMQGLKGRAVSESRDYLLVVLAATDPAACKTTPTACARSFVLRNPASTFSLDAFDAGSPYSAAEKGADDAYLTGADVARNGGEWTPEAPFAAGWATGFSSCKGRSCFALRFTSRGEVLPEPAASPMPAGYSFLVNPVNVVNAATERRGVLVSFPAGIVKTRVY